MFAVSGSVQAHNGDGSGGGGRSKQSHEVSPSSTQSPEQESEDETEHTVEHEQEDALKQERNIRVQLQAKRQEKKDEQRIKRCEVKEAGAKKRFETIRTNSANVKSSIDKIFARVEAFAVKKNIVVENETTLKADIAAKAQAVEEAVANIKQTSEGFSCQNDDAAQQVALIKSQVEVYKTAIKSYRQAVKTYFKAILSKLEAQESSSPSAAPSTTNQGGV